MALATPGGLAPEKIGLSQTLSQVLRELGYHKFTPIQEIAIPLLLKGGDLIGQAKTGSGKTAAFALPILQKVNLQRRDVQALILCPTRELCTQVAREIRKLARYHAGLQVLILSGGQPVGPQLGALEKGAHIVVGTPGRVGDLLKRKRLRLNQMRTLVLDEADRMLDMGFYDQIKEIISFTPTKRQTVLFSATFPAAIAEISAAYQNQAQHIKIEAAVSDDCQIAQSYIEVAYEEKAAVLIKLLQFYRPESALVFCNLKATVSDVATKLHKAGIATGCLHGDLEQFDRDRVLAQFRNGSIRALVASDVAARGIDVADLDLVINFDLPSQPEVYVHRIGRTGRAGKSGKAIALVTEREAHKIQSITDAAQHLEKTWVPFPIADKGPLPAKMQTLYLGSGRKEKLRPGDILGALTGEAGRLQGSNIGKIEIHDRYAYVALQKEIASLAYTNLQQGRIKGRKINVELLS